MVNENKTRPTSDSVDVFIANIDGSQRAEAKQLVAMMKKASSENPVLWGSIIGFGQYHYKSAAGREGDWMKIGFSPRKGKFSLYLMTNLDNVAEELKQLGKHERGKGCLYIKRLEDINKDVLQQLLATAYDMAGKV